MFIIACTKDREITTPDDNTPPPGPVGYLVGASGVLKINEFVAKGSINPNDQGENSDWIEIYNPGNDTAKLEVGRWFITDDASGDPEKFSLPEIIMPPKSFVIFWCDNLDGLTPGGHIHTSFGLSSDGENLGLFYQDDDDNTIEVDSYEYSAHTQDGYSEGRNPDGSPNWQFFPNPTPGESNQ